MVNIVWFLIFTGFCVYLNKKFENQATKEDIKDIEYLKKKAENFATKEDVKEITKAVESIKHQYATQLFIQQTRYRNEHALLQQLAKKVIQLREATLSL